VYGHVEAAFRDNRLDTALFQVGRGTAGAQLGAGGLGVCAWGAGGWLGLRPACPAGASWLPGWAACLPPRPAAAACATALLAPSHGPAGAGVRRPRPEAVP
jgi:hypothetical protein